MTTELPTPSDLLRRFRRRAKKSLGQHFLIDPGVLTRIAREATRTRPDEVVEIGPGPGALTCALLGTGVPVRAIEKDSDAVAFLRAELEPAVPPGALTVLEGDALELELPDDGHRRVLAGNLPYNVGSQIFFRALELRDRIERMVFMFQKEVALRFVAEPGTKAHGILSLMADFHFAETRILTTIGPRAFVPPPRVDSAVVVFERATDTPLPLELEGELRAVIHQAFSQRRKTLPNTLAGLWGLDKPAIIAALESLDIEPRRRAESLDIDAFCQLTIALRAASGRT